MRQRISAHEPLQIIHDGMLLVERIVIFCRKLAALMPLIAILLAATALVDSTKRALKSKRRSGKSLKMVSHVIRV